MTHCHLLNKQSRFANLPHLCSAARLVFLLPSFEFVCQVLCYSGNHLVSLLERVWLRSNVFTSGLLFPHMFHLYLYLYDQAQSISSSQVSYKSFPVFMPELKVQKVLFSSLGSQFLAVNTSISCNIIGHLTCCKLATMTELDIYVRHHTM